MRRLHKGQDSSHWSFAKKLPSHVSNYIPPLMSTSSNSKSNKSYTSTAGRGPHLGSDRASAWCEQISSVRVRPRLPSALLWALPLVPVCSPPHAGACRQPQHVWSRALRLQCQLANASCTALGPASRTQRRRPQSGLRLHTTRPLGLGRQGSAIDTCAMPRLARSHRRAARNCTKTIRPMVTYPNVLPDSL